MQNAADTSATRGGGSSARAPLPASGSKRPSASQTAGKRKRVRRSKKQTVAADDTDRFADAQYVDLTTKTAILTAYLKKGSNISNIADEHNLKYRTVQSIVRRHKVRTGEERAPEVPVRDIRGRPKKFNDDEESVIAEIVREKPTLSLRKIRTLVEARLDRKDFGTSTLQTVVSKYKPSPSVVYHEVEPSVRAPIDSTVDIVSDESSLSKQLACNMHPQASPVNSINHTGHSEYRPGVLRPAELPLAPQATYAYPPLPPRSATETQTPDHNATPQVARACTSLPYPGWSPGHDNRVHGGGHPGSGGSFQGMQPYAWPHDAQAFARQPAAPHPFSGQPGALPATDIGLVSPHIGRPPYGAGGPYVCDPTSCSPAMGWPVDASRTPSSTPHGPYYSAFQGGVPQRPWSDGGGSVPHPSQYAVYPSAAAAAPSSHVPRQWPRPDAEHGGEQRQPRNH